MITAVLENILTSLKKDELLRHSLYTIGFLLLGALFSFLYDFSMSALLTPAQFGILFSLVSLHTMILVFSDAILLTVARFTARLVAEAKTERIYHLWQSVLKRTLIISLAAFLLLAASSLPIARFLHLDTAAYPIILFSFTVFVFGLAVNRGVLQGLQRFIPFGGALALGHLLKFGLGAGLVFLGMEIYGGIAAIPAAFAIAFLVSFIFLRRLPRNQDREASFAGFGSFAGLALLAVLAITTLTNIDVVLTRHYLDETTAGNYATLSLLGRVIFYAPMGIGLALFPKTAQLSENAGEHRRLFRKSLLLTLITAAAGLAVYWLFPEPILELLFGGKYSTIAPYMLRYGAAMALFAVAYLMMSYFLSLNRTGISFLLLGTAAVQIALICCWHGGIDQLVNAMLISGGLSVILLLPWHYRCG